MKTDLPWVLQNSEIDLPGVRAVLQLLKEGADRPALAPVADEVIHHHHALAV